MFYNKYENKEIEPLEFLKRLSLSILKKFVYLYILILSSCSPKQDSMMQDLVSFLGSGSTSSSSSNATSTLEQQNPNPVQTVPIPTGFGSTGPEARLDFNALAFDRYSNIKILFSHSMNAATLNSSTVQLWNVTDSTNVSLVGAIFEWTSPLNLAIKPVSLLGQNKTYRLTISTSALTTTSLNLISFVEEFFSEPTFPATLKVIGSSEFLFSNNSALILSKLSHPSLSLQVNLDSSSLPAIKSLSLCKLGILSNASGIIPCTSGIASGLELCSNGSCPATITTDLSILPLDLRARDGINNYFYRIESFSGKYYYRTLNFTYGNLASDPVQKISNSVNLAIMQAEGVNAISGIIQSFARGEFTLKDPLDSSNKSLNQYLANTSNTHPGTDSSGNTCSPWPVAKLPGGVLTYFNRIGPFCGFSVSGVIFESSTYPNVNYSALADVYITELELDESILDAGTWIDNIRIEIKPENGYLDLTLYGRKAKGRLAIIAKVTDIEFFDYLIGDSLVYFGSLVSGVDGDGIRFSLNESPPSITERRTFARTILTANSSGDAVITMNPSAFPSPYNSSTDCLSLPNPVPFPYTLFCNPFTTIWSDNITTSSIVGSGAVAAIVGDIIQQKLPEIKPKVVQGVVRDIATKIAPDILNNILGQVKSGVTIGLPDYLPAPLSDIDLTIQAQLSTNTQTRNDGSNFGLEAAADASLLICIKDGMNRCPWQLGYSRSPLPPPPTGSNSFVLNKPTATLLPSLQSRWASNPGLLLQIHTDTINQAFYWLWRSGGLNLTIDEAFIDSINNYSGGSSLLRLTKSLLKADPILTVLAPGQNNFSGIYKNDEVRLIVNPIVAPYLEYEKLSGNASLESPKLKIFLSDLKITIRGYQSDPSRPAPSPSTAYTIGAVRISIQSLASLNLGTFALPTCSIPPCNFSPVILASVGNPSIKIAISDQVGELFFVLEVLEGAENPLNLKPEAIYQVIQPLVRDLIIPLLNNVVKDIPIPRLRACGLNLTAVSIKPIAGNTPYPYLLLGANAGNYSFTGNCEL